jgi:hypothetical protein
VAASNVISLPISATVTAALATVAKELATGDGPVVVKSDQLQLPNAAMTEFTAPRPGGSSALTATPSSEAEADVRVLHHRVVDVVTDRHNCSAADARAIGVLRLAAADRQRAATALQGAAEELPRESIPDRCFDWLVIVLVRAGIPIRAEPVDPWPWSLQDEVPQLSVPEADRIRLTRATRADDGVYSLAVLRRLSKPLSGFAAARGWSPNTITIVSLVVGLAAALSFAVGERWALVVGAVLLQVSIIIDCSDGEVARLTGRYSTVGAWLDAATDRIKEYAAYAGLAWGVWSAGSDIWWLAGATMTLQTARHLSDYTFHQVQVHRETADVVRSLSDTADTGGRYRGIVGVATNLNRQPLLRSIKKIIFLPIGERWLIISVTAAFLSPWWTFGLLLVLGALSAGYALAGRVLRTRSWSRNRVGADLIEPQLDAGPISLLLGRFPGPALAGPLFLLSLFAWFAFLLTLPAVLSAAALVVVAVLLPSASRPLVGLRYGWLLPSVLAVVELVGWLAITASLDPQLAPWGFAMAGVVAFHRYDLLYRALAGLPAPVWVRMICGGTDGRLVLMALLVMAGTVTFGVALPVLVAVLTLTAVGVASVQWVRQTAAVTAGSSS